MKKGLAKYLLYNGLSYLMLILLNLTSWKTKMNSKKEELILNVMMPNSKSFPKGSLMLPSSKMKSVRSKS